MNSGDSWHDLFNKSLDIFYNNTQLEEIKSSEWSGEAAVINIGMIEIATYIREGPNDTRVDDWSVLSSVRWNRDIQSMIDILALQNDYRVSFWANVFIKYALTFPAAELSSFRLNGDFAEDSQLHSFIHFI